MADVLSGGEIAKMVIDHHEAVYRYAYRLTGSVHDAEDLTQEVFLIAQRKMGQLRKADGAKSWLFAVARNSFLRERQRQRPASAADFDLDVNVLPDATPDDSVDGDRLQAVLNRLPEVFRVAVVMYYFEERSYKEIADELHVPIGTVMSRLARAREHLRAMLLAAELKTPNQQPEKDAEKGPV